MGIINNLINNLFKKLFRGRNEISLISPPKDPSWTGVKVHCFVVVVVFQIQQTQSPHTRNCRSLCPKWESGFHSYHKGHTPITTISRAGQKWAGNHRTQETKVPFSWVPQRLAVHGMPLSPAPKMSLTSFSSSPPSPWDFSCPLSWLASENHQGWANKIAHLNCVCCFPVYKTLLVRVGPPPHWRMWLWSLSACFSVSL